MILGLMRKHARSWLIKIIMAVIILVFVLYFGYSFRAQRGLRIAKVNGDVITRAEYQTEYNRLYKIFKETYGDAWNEKIARALNLKRLALENLINQRIMAQEAKRLGIEVSAKEIQKIIMKYPAFQVNGIFNVRLYKRLLSDNRMSPEEFENGIAKQILSDKLKNFILSFMNVTDQEALDYYRYKNEKIKISYVIFKPDIFKKEVKVTKAMIEEFFKKNKEKYRVPIKIKFAYIVINPKQFEDKIKPTEQEIKEYYNYHMDDYRLPGEKEAPPLKDIKDKVIRDLIDEKSIDLAQEKGYELIDKMPYDLDLATYAKDNGLQIKYTEYISQKDEFIPNIGGDNKIIQKLFDLKGKDVSDLIMLRGKFYIFQIADKKSSYIPKLKDVFYKVKEDLIKKLAMEKAKTVAKEYLKELKDGKDWKKLAKRKKVKIKYTDFFTRMDPIPQINGSRALREVLFSLNENRRYPDNVYSNYNGAYVIRWEGRKDINMDDFFKQKSKIKLQISYIKREEAFNAWIRDLRKVAKIEFFGSL